MPEELPLEPDLIKVLAADTRREILGLLQDRRMTVTELSRELELGKATVHEHLNKLTGAGLVQREEDDRLWVYYELTGRGKRLLNPQRTRFYLALTAAVVAALVAGLAVYGFMIMGGFGSGVDEQAQASPEFTASLAEQEAYAGDHVELRADLNGSEDVQAYLVDEESASRIRQGDLSVEGLPMHAQAAPGADGTSGDADVEVRGNTTLLRSDASLPGGTYYLYVRGAQGDNAPSMPSIRLIGLQAQPEVSTWYRGLDEGPATIEVTREGEALEEGRLRLIGPADTRIHEPVPIEQGQAQLPTSVMDEHEAGVYRISVQPMDTSRWIDLEATVTIADPSLAAVPLHGHEHEPTPIDIYLDGPDRLFEQAPRLQGAQASITNTSTGWRVTLEPREPGRVGLDLARQPMGRLTIHPAVSLEAHVQDGRQVNWVVERLDGHPVQDAAFYLDGESRGFTDANGTITMELPENGTHRIEVHRPDGMSVKRAITVDGWRIDDVPHSVRLLPVDIEASQGRANVTVEVHNEHPLATSLTLVAAVDGQPATSRGLSIPGDENRTLSLTVPAEAGRQEVTVQAHALDNGPFAYHNETTSADDEDDQDASEAPTGEDGDEGASAEMEADEGTSSTSMPLPGSETADGLNDGDAARDGRSALEPISPESAMDGDAAAEGTSQTPAAGFLVAIGVLVVAAGLARARQPKP